MQNWKMSAVTALFALAIATPASFAGDSDMSGTRHRVCNSAGNDCHWVNGDRDNSDHEGTSDDYQKQNSDEYQNQNSDDYRNQNGDRDRYRNDNERHNRCKQDDENSAACNNTDDDNNPQ